MTKEKLRKTILDFSGMDIDNPRCSASDIIYFLNDKEVGRCRLPDFSDIRIRHSIAKFCKIESYNNFHIIRDNKEIPMIDASKHFGNEITMGIPSDIDFGKYEGKMYEYYKYREVCSCCGSPKYILTFEQSKEIEEKIKSRNA